jgi:hypothetical protein
MRDFTPGKVVEDNLRFVPHVRWCDNPRENFLRIRDNKLWDALDEKRLRQRLKNNPSNLK